MTLQQRSRGVKVLKAISSSLRLQILNLLYEKTTLSYTELMNSLKLNPSRDAGRFAYHLKFLLNADLVEVDSEAKKYCLTDLGKMVIDVAERVEKKAVKTRGMMVRTSHSTLEEFDANKIANSLIREAKIPPDLAQKAAKETEKRLLKSKTRYVTAPLIREVVNALLIEKGLEDYRHKLTRLGLPVHEVTSLIEGRESPNPLVPVVVTAGKTVMREYILLNVFPRDIADAHVSGAIHINGLSTWVLKPSEIMHDIRFFLQNGLKFDALSPFLISQNPPHNFESALSTIFNALLHAGEETDERQVVDYFNVFLAPFSRGRDIGNLKESIRLFILNLNQNAQVSLGLELAIPEFIGKREAIGPLGKSTGKYAEFAQESLQLASAIIEIFAEESQYKPILNPGLIIKINDAAIVDEKAKNILLKAHVLAAEKGIPYFADMTKKGTKYAVFSTSGCKLEADLDEEWEIYTLRTGCLGQVVINLPRIVRESEKDKNKFHEILRDRCELSARAIEIKYRALKQFGRNSLPFLLQNMNGDSYFRPEDSTSLLNLAGFRETVEDFTGKPLNSEEGSKFAAEIVQTIQNFKHKIGRKHGKRMFPVILPNPQASERLAQLDIEKYGVAKVKFTGTREKPYYSTVRHMPIQIGDQLTIPNEALLHDRKIKDLKAGGSLTILELESTPIKPEELMKLTLSLCESQSLEFFTYNRRITYCNNCKKNYFGILHKCPSCGSVATMTAFDRFSST